MGKSLLLLLLFLVLNACSSIEIETSGWKAIDGTGIKKEALEALQQANAPQKAFRIGGMVLIETSCKATYNTTFRGVTGLAGTNVCGASAQADSVTSEINPQDMLMIYLMDKYGVAPQPE